MPQLDSLKIPITVDDNQSSPETAGRIRWSNNHLFGDWSKIENNNLTLHDRILISILAVSYSQSPKDSKIEEYVAGLNSEIKVAFASLAHDIVANHDIKIDRAIREESIQVSWAEAAKFGLSRYLEDFSVSQNQSYQALDELVRDRTSWRAQLLVAFGVAFALSLFVGLSKYAVTITDDILPAKTENVTP